MFTANCYTVMIVSPSDVVRERGIVKETIHEWNTVHAASTGIILQPIGWDINSYPQMGDHPQSILNKQILENADILVGMFWTKIGTKTEHYESGSVEEIERHTEAGKPTLLYFSNNPVVLNSVDQSQYQRLNDYKTSIKDKGFYNEYGSPDEFAGLFRKHISLLVQDQLNPDAGATFADSTDQPSQTTHTLSDIEQKFIIGASQDSSGIIGRFPTLGGTTYQVNGEAYGGREVDPREAAELEEAIENLELLGLISAASYKRHVFNLSAEGYRVADQLKKNSAS